MKLPSRTPTRVPSPTPPSDGGEDQAAPMPSRSAMSVRQLPEETAARLGVKTQKAPIKPKTDEQIAGLDALRDKVRATVVAELGPSLVNGSLDESKVRQLLELHLDEAARATRVTVPPSDRTAFVDAVYQDMLGWGVLTPLMADPDVSEIMCNGIDKIYVERNGKLTLSDVHFPSVQSYRTVIDRMLAVAGRRVDEASPMADGRLKDGSRINAIIPPLVVGDPVLTIRRFPESALTTEKLINMGSMTRESQLFLDACVRGQLNIIVSGGTGTGKTTMLNALSASVPYDDRIITIEDAAELRLSQPHVVTLEARPSNAEGAGLVSIRDLVKNALRMRPDRIVVGECRGQEAIDMLQAMNTGHEGSMTTVHANTPRDALSRLETMILLAGIDLPLRAIREQLASAVHLIVQLQRRPDGRRVVSHITEIQGREGDVITMQDIFGRTGDGPLAATGLRPRCVERIEEKGVTIPPNIFRRTETTTDASAPAFTRKGR